MIGRGNSLNQIKARFGVLIVMPTIIILVTVLVYPLLYSINLSFYHFEFLSKKGFIGLGNYINTFQNVRFINSLRITFIYVFMTVSLEFLFGFALALLLNSNLNDKGLFRTLILVPLMVSPTVVALTWRWLFNDSYGLINYLLRSIGIKSPPLWLADPFWAFISIIIVDVWLYTPFVMLILLAALQSVPREQYEAAAIDGASSWQSLWHITIPWLKAAITIIIVIRSMDAFRVFDFIYVLTSGGPAQATETIVFYNYKVSFSYWDISKGAAISTLCLIIIFLSTLFYLKLSALKTKRSSFY